MQIFIKTLRGKTITIDIFSNETILDLKHKIFVKVCIPIKLFSVTSILYEDSKTLHYPIIILLKKILYYSHSDNKENELPKYPLINKNYNKITKINSLERQYAFHPSYKKVRIQISLE